MVRITLNGDSKNLSGPTTIAHLLADMALAGKRVAVEVNQEIVPRSEHEQVTLKDGDQVEVVQAIGGG